MISTIRRNLVAIFQSNIVRGVGALVSGTAFAQAITVLSLPLITRLYTPDDFNLLAIYSAILGILAGIACLRLEIAIPLPENDEDAVNLLATALLIAIVFGLLSALLLVPFGNQFAALLGHPEFKPYIWLIPVAIWLSGSYTALQYWLTRKRRFPTIARSRINRALGSIGVQLGIGFLITGPFGLLFGQAVSNSAGITGLARNINQHDRTTLHAIRWTRMRNMLRRYQRFPKYSALESLANNGGIQIPVLLIAALAVGPEAGFLLLAMRTMAAPIGLLGGAIAQVYLSRAPEEARHGRLDELTRTMIGGLLKTGVGPLLFVGAVAPIIFPLIFGSSWYRAGEIVRYMTPWFIMQFLASPISMALHVLSRQSAALALQVFGLVLRTGTVLAFVAINPKIVIECYAASGVVFYFVYLLVIMSATNLRFFDFLRQIIKNIHYIAPWLIVGALIVWIY